MHSNTESKFFWQLTLKSLWIVFISCPFLRSYSHSFLGMMKEFNFSLRNWHFKNLCHSCSYLALCSHPPHWHSFWRMMIFFDFSSIIFLLYYYHYYYFILHHAFYRFRVCIRELSYEIPGMNLIWVGISTCWFDVFPFGSRQQHKVMRFLS